ncbi:MAG: hypothetical protein OHK005_11840 [Candidatus Methylacidiphilales bacterium]
MKAALICGAGLLVSLAVIAPSVRGEVSGVQFPVASMRLPVGETRTLSFAVETAATKDEILDVIAEPKDRVEIVRTPEILAGQMRGFLRLRMLASGSARVEVGGAKLALIGCVSGDGNARETPEIVTPVAGAQVWGTFSAAVEWVPSNALDAGERVELRSESGRTIAPDPDRSQALGWGRREVFVLNADEWKSDIETWTAVRMNKKGTILARGEPVRWTRVEFGKASDLADECEHHLEGSGQERFGESGPPAVEDDTASGGRRVNLVSGRPVWTFKTEVPETGWYQLILQAKADAAMGALPTAGIFVDDGENPVTNGRLAELGWHRVVVGLPFKLEAGERQITVQFRNDFASGRRVDRNLFLDRYELARVTGPSRSSSGFSVGFVERLDGREVMGPTEIFARARWPEYRREATPWIELWINGKLWADQRGGKVRFDVPVSAWRSGKNRVEVRARSEDLGEVRSEAQVVIWNGPTGTSGGRVLTFTVTDDRWDPGMEQRWTSQEEDGPVDSAAFFTNGEAVLRLPETLKGTYQVMLEGRGQEFEGPPEFLVSSQNGKGESQVGTATFRGNQNRVVAGMVELAGGEQTLKITFPNDHYVKGKGDRNIWLERMVLIEAKTEGASKPSLALAYPTSGTTISRQGLVLLRASGLERGDLVDVLVEGRVIASAPVPSDGFGPWFVSFGDRALPEGITELKAILRRGGEGRSLPEACRFRSRWQLRGQGRPTIVRFTCSIVSRMGLSQLWWLRCWRKANGPGLSGVCRLVRIVFRREVDGGQPEQGKDGTRRKRPWPGFRRLLIPSGPASFSGHKTISRSGSVRWELRQKRGNISGLPILGWHRSRNS